MSAELASHPKIQEAAARTQQLLVQPADAVFVEFVAECRALPPGHSAADLVSVLSRTTRRRLERVAMQHFHRQLRPRSDRTIPRALTEIRSASKAWSTSPLVLLVEFADAPTSDNFWRLLSKLSRTSRNWQLTRKRLHVERDRRHHDVLARRKGVSRTQPWAIPDIEAVLEQHEDMTPELECEIEQLDSGQCHGRLRGSKTATIGAVPKGKQLQPPIDSLSGPDLAESCNGLPSRDISLDDADSNLLGKAAKPVGGGPQQGKPALNRIFRRMMPVDKAKPSVWRFAYGWWLPDDLVHLLCTSIVHIQPSYVAVDPSDATSQTAMQSIDQTTPRIAVVPINVIATRNWALGIISHQERTISLYDSPPGCQPSNNSATAIINSAFANLVGKAALSGWALLRRACPTPESGADSGVAVVVFALYNLVGRCLPSTMDFWLWRRMFAYYVSRAFPLDAEDRQKEVEMAAEMAAKHTFTYHEDETWLDLPHSTGGSTKEAADAPITLTTALKQLSKSYSEPLHRSIKASQSSLAARRVALRNNAFEAKAVWAAAAQIAQKAEKDALACLCDGVPFLDVSQRPLFAAHGECGSPQQGGCAFMSPEDGVLATSPYHAEGHSEAVQAYVSELAAIKNAIRVILQDLDELVAWLARSSVVEDA